MKVLCIDKSKFKNEGTNDENRKLVQKYIDEIKEGEAYLAVGEIFKNYFILAEFENIYWEKEGFAPVSDQDNLQLTEQEAEMIRRRHLVHVKLVS